MLENGLTDARVNSPHVLLHPALHKLMAVRVDIGDVSLEALLTSEYEQIVHENEMLRHGHALPIQKVTALWGEAALFSQASQLHTGTQSLVPRSLSRRDVVLMLSELG